jgi:putative DNA primase/helicase
MNMTALRLGLLDHGYIPLPITNPDAPGKDAGKRPTLKHWQTVETTPAAIRSWERSRRHETNTGLRCGHLLGIDVDVRDGGLVHRLLDLASDTIGATPLMRIGQAPKTLLAYRTEIPFTKIKTPRLLMPGGQHALIECLATGQQFVGFGIHPGTRQPYRWPRATPLDVPLSELPAMTEAQARAFVAEAERLLRNAGGHPEAKDEPADATPRSRATRPASAWSPPTRQDVAAALKAVPDRTVTILVAFASPGPTMMYKCQRRMS